jgi:1,4-dihydroxy-2-naphthoate octaprenyltransferase
MIFAGLLVSAVPSWTIVIFAAMYGALQKGVILVNTAEDYPEDLAAHIRTTVVALGLHRGIALAFWLTSIGAVGVLITLVVLFQQREGGLLWLIALLPAVAACVYVIGSIWKLKRAIAGCDLATSIQTVKRTAKKVPIWITVVAWSMLGAAFALFYMTKV